MDAWTFGGESFESWVEGGGVIVAMIAIVAYGAWDGVRRKRHSVELDLLPRKRQLETRLMELENQKCLQTSSHDLV